MRRETRERLPKLCECGGRMIYSVAFRRVFSCCAKCTPVVNVRRPRAEEERVVKPATQEDR